MEAYKNKQVLKELYLEKGLYQREIAKIFDVSRRTISNWIRKYNIPTRSGYGSMKKSNEWFLAKFNQLSDSNNYKFLDEYDGFHTPIKCEHIVCGNIWKVTPGHFLGDKTRCPKCINKINAKKLRKTQREFEEEVKEKFSDYDVISNYHKYHSKTIFRHKTCGNTFKMTNHGFLNGQNQCRYCAKRSSSYERKAKKQLDSLNINYIEQYTFEKCKNKDVLPFDFAIFVNDELDHLLEIDGRQHFEPVLQFGGKEKFKDIKKKDKIKENFCRANDIKLIRIDARKWQVYKIICS